MERTFMPLLVPEDGHTDQLRRHQLRLLHLQQQRADTQAHHPSINNCHCTYDEQKKCLGSTG